MTTERATSLGDRAQIGGSRTVEFLGATLLVPDAFVFQGTSTNECSGITATVDVYKHALTGMEFVLVPGGEGEVGCGTADPEHKWHEKPRHRVAVRPFLMGRYPVTQGVWQRAMGSSDLTELGDMHPVAHVLLDECHEFCRRTGLELPSEAEWEYACRAGRSTDDMPMLHDHAWFAENCDDLQPIGLKKPNAFGIHDMLGTVWEWCADSWHDTYAGAPTDGTPWIDRTSSYGTARGSSFEHGPDACTASCRMFFPRDIRGLFTGFRTKCSLQVQNGKPLRVPTASRVIPDKFVSLGAKTSVFGGVTYSMEWIRHARTGLELPLLPGGLYCPDTLPQLWRQAQVLFTETVIVTRNGCSHPDLLNALLRYGNALYPVLMAYFLTGDTRTRVHAAFWHTELSIAIYERLPSCTHTLDNLPTAMPSGEVLAAALQESEESVRTMAAAAFGCFCEHSTPFVPRLAELLADPDACPVVLEAMIRLSFHAGEAMHEIAGIALRHEDKKIVGLAVEAIEAMSVPVLRGSIPEHAKAAAIPLLSELSASDAGFASATAACALWLLSTEPDTVVIPLLASLSHDDPRARAKSARVLGEIGAADDRIRRALQDHVADPDPTVRNAVAHAMRRINVQ